MPPTTERAAAAAGVDGSSRSVPTERSRLDRTGGLALAATVTTWAAAFPAISTGLQGYHPLSLGLLRLLVASCSLGLLAVALRPARPRGPDIARVAVLGLLGQALYQALLMTGQLDVPAGTAALLIATAPVFSVAMARLVLGERVGHRWIGLAVSLTGAGLVAVSRGVEGAAVLPALAVLAAAVCQGTYHVLVKPVARRIGSLAATTWSVVAGTMLSLPALPLLLSDLPDAPATATAAAVFLGVVPSAVGYLTWSVAVARATIARATVGLYLVPVVAVVLAWLWLGEVPGAVASLGGVVAIVGVVLVRRS